MDKKAYFGITIIVVMGIILGILLVASVPILAVVAAPPSEWFSFRTLTEPIPEDAEIIILTEDDYEKYPMLRNIPESFYIDKGILSDYYIRPGCVDNETGWAIREKYGYYAGGGNRYIEHNGIIYRVDLSVA